MKVLILSNGKLEEKEIENKLENLQKEVGGYIEMPFICKEFLDNNICAIINEEGKYIDGLRKELAFIKGNNVLDVIFGNIVFTGVNKADNVSLNDKQIDIIKDKLSLEAVLTDEKESILVKVVMV